MRRLLLFLLVGACGTDTQFSEEIDYGTTLNAVAAAGYSVQFVSLTGIPATVVPGARYLVDVTVVNNGSIPWLPGTDRLLSRNSPASLWGWTTTYVNTTVNPGDTHTFSFPVTAPNVSGPVSFLASMHHDDSVQATRGVFGNSGPASTTGDAVAVVNVTFNGDTTGTADFDADLVSANFGGPYQPNQYSTITITMRNSGNQPWSGTDFALRNLTPTVVGPSFVLLGAAETVPVGGNRVFNINIRAPATAGNYVSSWRMFRADVGTFGDTVSGTIEVPSGAGCADNQREGFRDGNMFPSVAGCAGGWSLPGVNAAVAAPACNRAAGDDSANANGMGCNVNDLCAAGWHVCASRTEVNNLVGTCTGATQTGDAPLFFTTRQSGLASLACNTSGANDIYGCGNIGLTPGTSCNPLNRSSGNLCSQIGAPWSCGSVTTAEATNVVKNGPTRGGVLCCID